MSENLDFGTIPKGATLKAAKFRVNIPDAALDELNLLLKHTKVPADTYESVQEDRRFGVTTKWIRDAKAQWEDDFDWRKHEAHINSFPHYLSIITDDDGHQYEMHYVALFSEKPDAVPIVLLHGWPGSFLEFLPILEILRTKYSRITLPYHIIVPSLPGYAFSSAPPLERDFQLEDAARLIDKLMVGLGFGSGYVAQGGDIGSELTRLLANLYPSCKAVHLNLCPISEPPESAAHVKLTDSETAGLQRGKEFGDSGSAYGIMHATRPSTIGIVLASNPIALLAWIGEKFIAWSDVTPPLDTIIESVALYWLTETFPSSIWPYRQVFGTTHKQDTNFRKIHNAKPLGFSSFPKEILPVPESWVATTGNLVHFRSHTEGGHFAALEQPEALLGDIEEFVAQVWVGAREV